MRMRFPGFGYWSALLATFVMIGAIVGCEGLGKIFGPQENQSNPTSPAPTQPQTNSPNTNTVILPQVTPAPADPKESRAETVIREVAAPIATTLDPLTGGMASGIVLLAGLLARQIRKTITLVQDLENTEASFRETLSRNPDALAVTSKRTQEFGAYVARDEH